LFTCLAVIFFLPFIGVNVRAQEGLRMSAAGEEAATARRQAAQLPQYYNLKLGDLQLRLNSSLGVEANDNVSLADTNLEGDLIFSPEVSTVASYPLSDKNTLNLSLGVGYSYYLEHKDLNRFFVRPGTELSFDIFIKDVVLNLHDRASVVNQGYNATAGGTGNYSYLENVMGISADWDLNKMEVNVSYDHLQRISLTTQSASKSVDTNAPKSTAAGNIQDSTEEIFSGSVGANVTPYSVVGIQASATIISYEQTNLNGGVQYSAGLFYKTRVSEHLTFSASAGYFIYFLDVSNPTTVTTNFVNDGMGGITAVPVTNTAATTIDAVYYSLSLDHQVNAHLSYNIEAGRQVQAGLFSDTLDLYYARISANWGIVRKLPITTRFSYENGNESGGIGEKIERFGFGIGCSRAITQKLSSSLYFEHWLRYSDLPNRNYTQNRVMLTLNYSF
jgi:hypothetical protein